MTKIKLSLVAAAFAITASSAFAQNTSNKWLIGVGAHAIDWTSVRSPFSGYFDTDDYQMVPPLSKLTVGRSLSKSFAVDLSATIGEVDYERQDIHAVGEQGPINDEFFLNAGLGVKYKFANDYILKETSFFDPYLRAGVNYTKYDFSKVNESENFVGLTGGAGFNIWIAKNFGLNLESSYNWLPAGTRDHQDYFQHSAGLVFRFGGKDTDKDGIQDDKDACPEVFGLKEFNGCPDTDGDKITDAEDSCPEVFGLSSLQGCPDADGDGVADKDDACPEIPGPVEFNGCPDRDKDGVLDMEDACPDVYGLAKFNGCPDTDGDGIQDSKDKCPTEAGPASNQGCPDVSKEVSDNFNQVYFDFAKSTIRPESNAKLDKAAQRLNSVPGNYLVEGFTDARGSDAINLKLSRERAKAVVDALVARGVDASRLKSVGYGSSQARVSASASDAERMVDRKVTARLISGTEWDSIPVSDIPVQVKKAVKKRRK